MDRRRLFLVAVSVAVIAAADAGYADVLCKTRKGVVVVRAACKPKETKLDPDALGLRGSQGAKGDPGQQGATGSTGATGRQGPGLVVKDANGTLVGLVANPENLPGPLQVLRRTSSGFLRFSIPTTLDALAPSSGIGGEYDYTSNNCSGQPLLRDVPAPNWVQDTYSSGNPSDTNLYYPTGTSGSMYVVNSDVQDTFFQAASQADCNSNYGSPQCGVVFVPPSFCCLPLCQPLTRTLWPLSSLAVIDPQGAALGLVPPFHVEGP